MTTKPNARRGILQWLGCILLGAILFACQSGRTIGPVESAEISALKRVVVIGFSPAMGRHELPDIVRSPVTGSAFMAQPVPLEVTTSLTEKLYENLLAKKRWTIIPPGQARGVFGSILGSDKKMGMGMVEVIKEVGNTFAAEAVLGGSVYRWRERRGSDYAVDFPASVAFDLWLVRSSDGVVLWKGSYDKTQQSLMENLLDYSTFAESQGKWLTAEKLAMIGLKKLFDEMPGIPVKEEKKE